MKDSSLRILADRCRERLREERYQQVAAGLSDELQRLLDHIEARVSLENLIDEYACAAHGTRSGPPTEDDFSCAYVRVWRQFKQLRTKLDL